MVLACTVMVVVFFYFASPSLMPHALFGFGFVIRFMFHVVVDEDDGQTLFEVKSVEFQKKHQN